MVEFITRDPFTDRYRQGVEFAQNRAFNDIRLDAADFDLSEAQRLSRESQARDVAIREALASLNPQGGGQVQQPGAFAAGAGGPPAVPATNTNGGGSLYDRSGALNDAVVSRLMDVPGAGNMALETARGDLNQEWNFLKEGMAIAERDPGLAMQFYQSVGMPLPQGMEGILTDRDARAEFTSILAEAENLYPGLSNAAARRQYVLGRMQGMSAVDATTQVGAPSTQAAQQPVNNQMITDAQGNVFAWNPRTNATEAIIVNGKQLNVGVDSGSQDIELVNTDQGLVVRVGTQFYPATMQQVTTQEVPAGPPGNRTTQTTVENVPLTQNTTGGSNDRTAFERNVSFAAQLYAQMNGREQPNDDDWSRALADQNSSSVNRPDLIRRYTAMILESNKNFYGNPTISADEATRQATQIVDGLLASGGTSQGGSTIQQTGSGSLDNGALGGNSGNAGLSNIPLAPQSAADRVVGQQYRSPDGRVGTWTGSGWQVQQ